MKPVTLLHQPCRYHPYLGQRHQYPHQSVPKFLSNPASYQSQLGVTGWAKAGTAPIRASIATTSIPINVRTKSLRFMALRTPFCIALHQLAHLSKAPGLEASTESRISTTLKYESGEHIHQLPRRVSSRKPR